MITILIYHKTMYLSHYPSVYGEYLTNYPSIFVLHESVTVMSVYYEDNLTTGTMPMNPVRRKYSRPWHIDIRRRYVHDLALTGVIKLVPLGTHDMVPDVLTKSLLVPSPRLGRHHEAMMDH